jgi:hypothetical protein
VAGFLALQARGLAELLAPGALGGDGVLVGGVGGFDGGGLLHHAAVIGQPALVVLLFLTQL